jgi:hypothetical protein
MMKFLRGLFSKDPEIGSIYQLDRKKHSNPIRVVVEDVQNGFVHYRIRSENIRYNGLISESKFDFKFHYKKIA